MADQRRLRARNFKRPLPSMPCRLLSDPDAKVRSTAPTDLAVGPRREGKAEADRELLRDEDASVGAAAARPPPWRTWVPGATSRPSRMLQGPRAGRAPKCGGRAGQTDARERHPGHRIRLLKDREAAVRPPR